MGVARHALAGRGRLQLSLPVPGRGWAYRDSAVLGRAQMFWCPEQNGARLHSQQNLLMLLT